jgi:hypothetical protein
VRIGLHPVGALLCQRELALQATDATLGLGLHAGDALVRLSLRPVDARVGVGLQLGDGSFDLRSQPVDEPVGRARAG